MKSEPTKKIKRKKKQLTCSLLRSDANQRKILKQKERRMDLEGKILKHQRRKDGLLRERKKARFGFPRESERKWVPKGKRREKERKAFIRVIRFSGITLKKKKKAFIFFLIYSIF